LVLGGFAVVRYLCFEIAAMECPTSNTQALPAGTRLEEFVIERVLGSGGFGITYLARDTRLDRKVVIKENLPAQFCFRDLHSLTVAPRHTHGEDAENFRWSLQNFSKEAAMLASLDHPGIVKVLRSFEAFGTAYFVMPYLEGFTFDELIASRRYKGQEFSEEELLGFLCHVLGALGYLHDRGVYHRDIKPGNLFVTLEGMPVLIDFGSARQRLSERSMTVIESAGYTPFEQLQSRGNVGPWSDLYALGGSLERAITGWAPPKAADRIGKDPRDPLATLQNLPGRASPAFLASIDRALKLDAQERWQSAGQWQEALVMVQMGHHGTSTHTQSPQGFQEQGEELEHKNRLSEAAHSSVLCEEEPEENGLIKEPSPRDRWSRGSLVVAALVGVAVICSVSWVMTQLSSSGDTSAPAFERVSFETPGAQGTSLVAAATPSPFHAATAKPTDWLHLAEAGDSLAQALLGDALYWGGQINHGINEDPAAGVKWIGKSATAGHPLGIYLLGLIKDQDGKWIPRDGKAAKEAYEKAISTGLLRDAENGGHVWWTAVAQALESGKGIEPDPKTAIKWYARAAEAGYVDAMNGLAYCYDRGTGVAEDDEAAINWYKKSAEAGSSDGMSMLASGYLHGTGVPRNPSEAIKWFRKAAELGQSMAQTRLGECYAEGEGVPKDLTEAVKWYQRAADQGDAEAQILLGTAYEFGDGVAENAAMAAQWYRKAAEQGDAEGQSNLGDCLRYGEGVPEDPEEAVKMYRLAAEQGYYFAENSLGECYAEGIGVQRNLAEAVKWYSSAAEKGCASAQNSLGAYFENQGNGLNNPAEAVTWYRKAAEQGFAIAQVNLGRCYAAGSGVSKDLGEAVKWYREAAAKDYPLAQLMLGLSYADGEGVSQDYSQAVKWYRKAADDGLAAAQNELGVCYYNGSGVTKSVIEAVKWCRRAADQGHAGAQSNLGHCYANGEGISMDHAEAARWYQKAAEQGHVDAQYSLGECYANGDGKTKNPSEAVRWYRKSAEQGHSDAQFSMGLCYEKGVGVSRNSAESVKWYEKAAAQGHPVAQSNLGVCYAGGLGVPKNIVIAYVWTGMAAESGVAQANENLPIIASEMSSAELDEAKRIGREWKAKQDADVPPVD
jgi:TPR repeat protein/serine/threonine protein kinase